MPKRAKRAKGSSSSSAAPDATETSDTRPHAIVEGLECTSDIGWGRIMGYATAEERARYARLSVAFGRGAAKLKRKALFGNWTLALDDGSLALDRVEAASIRFPALEDVYVNLSCSLSVRDVYFDDASRAPILAKLCTFTFITRLDLDSNHIAVLPDEIGALTKLKHLGLNFNKLTTLPPSIGSLTALKTLWLHGNKLTAVPTTIGGMTALTTLTLGGNELVTLPDSIGELTGLETLSLNNNKLAILPDSIGQLTGLTKLYLNNNNLTRLPDSIVGLRNLTVLTLTNARAIHRGADVAPSNPNFSLSAQSTEVQTWLRALGL